MDYLNIYSKLFGDGYNKYGSNEIGSSHTIDFIKKNNVKKIIDISTGIGSIPNLIRKEIPDVDITCTDLKNFNNLPYKFIPVDLSKDSDLQKLKTNDYDLLTCLDVLEHLDKSFIENVLNNFSRISKNVILTIANHSDVQNNIELHTIIEDMSYWKPLIDKYFIIINQESYDFPQKNNSVNYLYSLILKSKLINN